MVELNPVAIAVATVAAFVLSSVWYLAFGARLARLSPAYAEQARSPALNVLAEVGRSLIVALVTAGLASLTRIQGLDEAVLLGVALWVGFPLVLLTGAVIHEGVTVPLAAIHAGDWLLKLLLIAAVVGLWR
jgi:thiosulfate reductase cytochrome b subunit